MCGAWLSLWCRRSGVNFDPPQWLIDHSNKENGNSTAGLDYVWSHFCGIFMGTHARMRIFLVRGAEWWPT